MDNGSTEWANGLLEATLAIILKALKYLMCACRITLARAYIIY